MQGTTNMVGGTCCWQACTDFPFAQGNVLPCYNQVNSKSYSQVYNACKNMGTLARVLLVGHSCPPTHTRPREYAVLHLPCVLTHLNTGRPACSHGVRCVILRAVLQAAVMLAQLGASSAGMAEAWVELGAVNGGR